MRHRRVPLAAAAAVASVLVLSACDPLGGEGPGHGYYSTPGEEGGEAAGAEEAEGSAAATATLLDVDGAEVGTVQVTEDETGVIVAVEVEGGLEPGSFHGFHVHESGVCQPESAAAGAPDEVGAFLSAGGHLSTDDQVHGEHAGDMPSLRALEDGSASMELHLDSVTLEDLEDVDGSAFMVHAGPDNFANIPERYAPAGPDEETLSTGDSGDRIACGVLESGPAAAVS